MSGLPPDNEKMQPVRPAVRVYKRPMRKKASEPLATAHFFVEDTLKTARWKADEKVAEVVASLAKGKEFFEKSFAGRDFSGAPLRKAKMPFCIFSEAIFEGAVLREGDFNHADFQGADFRGADLSKADLSYTDLTGANLAGANLEGAILTGAKMDEVLFSEDTDFGGVVADAPVQKNIDKIMTLQEAAERGEIDLRSLGIVDLRKLDLRTLNLKGVYLKDKDLKGKLTGVNLSGAIINDSDILGADVNMIHYWIRDMNQYNEFIDAKKNLRKDAAEQQEVLLRAYENEEAMKRNLLDVATPKDDYLRPEYQPKLPEKHDSAALDKPAGEGGSDPEKTRRLQEYKKTLKSLYKEKKHTRARVKPVRGKIIS